MECNYPVLLNRDPALAVPCGKCMPCRINKREQWAFRIGLESDCHPCSVFVTLTYSDDNIPVTDAGNPTLKPKDTQLWMKRLRKALAPRKIRFFLVGEYGDKTGRPHYHAVLFNCWPMDSEAIQSSWSLGFTTCTTLTPQRARYTARYTTKKLCAEKLPFKDQTPIFMRCSNRPALGRQGFENLMSSLITTNGPDGTVTAQFSRHGKPVQLHPYLKKLMRSLVINEAGEQERQRRWREFSQTILQEFEADEETWHERKRQKENRLLRRERKHTSRSESI